MKRLFFILIPFFLLLGCKSDKHDETPAQFRIGQFIVGPNDIDISIYQKDETVYKEKFTYGSLSNYNELKPGKYLIKVRDSAQLLLQKEIGIGPEGKYTICLFGQPLAHQKVNKETLNSELHHIIEGSEGTTANGYLPQISILNDYFAADGSTAIRFMHLAPGITELTPILKSIKNDKEKKVSPLQYTELSDMELIKKEEYEIKIKLKNSEQQVKKITLTPKDNMLTYFIIPKQTEGISGVDLIR